MPLARDALLAPAAGTLPSYHPPCLSLEMHCSRPQQARYLVITPMPLARDALLAPAAGSLPSYHPDASRSRCTARARSRCGYYEARNATRNP
eukprot:scaffold21937_cov33-Phaeocystis_antarctica.AAC.2